MGTPIVQNENSKTVIERFQFVEKIRRNAYFENVLYLSFRQIESIVLFRYWVKALVDSRASRFLGSFRRFSWTYIICDWCRFKNFTITQKWKLRNHNTLNTLIIPDMESLLLNFTRSRDKYDTVMTGCFPEFNLVMINRSDSFVVRLSLHVVALVMNHISWEKRFWTDSVG